MDKELSLFHSYLKEKNLKNTKQRDKILEIFLRTEKHLSAEDLYKIIKEKFPDIGYTTVYRTIKLIRESGLAREVDFSDGFKRIEHNFGHQHHDHLICLKCGRFFEVVDKDIEKLQEKLAQRFNFKTVNHKMDIFGYCQRCLPAGRQVKNR